MVAEISDRRRVAQRLVFDDAPRRPPPMPVDPEPYVYNGPVSRQGRGATLLVVGGVVGALVVVGFLWTRLGVADQARKKAEFELANLTTSFGEQSRQLTSLEEARAKLAADVVTRDHEAQQVRTRAGQLRDALSAAVAGDDVSVESVDGRVRIAIADRAIFDDTGLALSDAGKALLAKVGAAVPKGDGAVDVVARGEARRSVKAAKLPKDAVLLPSDALTVSAAKAAAVVHALEEKVPARRLSAVGRGTAQPLPKLRNRGFEIVVTP